MSRTDWAQILDEDVGTYLGDTDNHVADGRFEGVDSTRLLLTTEPDANADERTIPLLSRLLHLLQLTGNVGEVLGNLATGALDSNFPCIHCALNCKNEESMVSQISQTST